VRSNLAICLSGWTQIARPSVIRSTLTTCYLIVSIDVKLRRSTPGEKQLTARSSNCCTPTVNWGGLPGSLATAETARRAVSVENNPVSCCATVPQKARLETTLYDTMRDAILTCAVRKPTWVSLIYRTETTTKKCKTEKKLKSKNGSAHK